MATLTLYRKYMDNSHIKTLEKMQKQYRRPVTVREFRNRLHISFPVAVFGAIMFAFILFVLGFAIFLLWFMIPGCFLAPFVLMADNRKIKQMLPVDRNDDIVELV